MRKRIGCFILLSVLVGNIFFQKDIKRMNNESPWVGAIKLTSVIEFNNNNESFINKGI